jgi:transcriptional regulator with XRE-family HTH domain
MAKIKRLASKGYRDTYLASRVRATIALQIRALRRSLRLSQQKFARMIGTTQSAVSDLENPDGDQVSVQTLLKIAAALNVALIVKFAGFPDFLKLMSDMSPKGLAVDTIDETIARSKRPQTIPALQRPVYFQVLAATANAAIADITTDDRRAPWIVGPLPSTQRQSSGLVLSTIGKSTQTFAKAG